MKLLIKQSDITKEFKRLIKQYSNFRWAAAWASAGNEVFGELIENRYKIHEITVGIHFFQTHPDFIKEFIDDENVRFIEQPEGTFHPKIYLFSNDKDEWELLVGSANFTASAFSINSEACLLVSSNDLNAEEVFNKALEIIDSSFDQGKVFSDADWENYFRVWNIHQTKIQSLSGQYGTKKSRPIPLHKVEFTTRSWDEFIDKVYDEGSYAIKTRLRVIEIAQQLFAKKTHFKELTEDERKFIAGIPNKLVDSIAGAEHWAYFGSMKGAGHFKNKIKDNNAFISLALDQIPLNGQITKIHYDHFVKYFKRALPGNYLATSTRLLAMKRPDVFICYDSKNNHAICKDFGIIKNNMDHERYWYDIILRIYDSNWWQNSDPKNEIESKIHDARSAFLDSIYYERFF
ncbi:phospholipase D family protein [Chryseobacterium sp.]|uniref:phospholipase D family protein n=1 Tax=Chryseobacterium sp. TaxID=1871047 RepID=UPI0028A0A866|nr:phospholipase D family protein [Chryseobacterium sp.]